MLKKLTVLSMVFTLLLPTLSFASELESAQTNDALVSQEATSTKEQAVPTTDVTVKDGGALPEQSSTTEDSKSNDPAVTEATELESQDEATVTTGKEEQAAPSTENAPVVTTEEEVTTTPALEDTTKVEQQATVSNGWVKEYGYLYYYVGGEPLTGWQTIDGKTYYFDDYSGYAYTGKEYLQDQYSLEYHYYYFNTSNASMTTGFVQIDGDWYYFGQDGKMATGWVQHNAKWYYLYTEEDLEWEYGYSYDYGYMATGYTYVVSEGKYYFLDSSGVCATNGWRYVEDEYESFWVYANVNGTLLTGWQKLGSAWYYLYESGGMATGILEDNGKIYLLSDSGTLVTKTGWNYYAPYEQWYYVKDFTGALYTGWLSLGGSWYYLDEDYGYMATGSNYVNGTSYFFNQSGVWVTKGWVSDGYNWYYLDSATSLHYGWLYTGGKWYYFSPYSGYMYEGYNKVNGVPYFFNTDGSMKTNGWASEVYGSTRYWFYAEASGVLRHDAWLSSGGNWYYFNEDGVMLAGVYYTIGFEVHYFDSNGIWRGSRSIYY